MVPFSFPLTKCALWDPVPMGDVVGSHISYYRNPKILVMEKTLRLAYRHAKQNEKQLFSCFLLGTLTVDDDGEGVTVTIDRFDPGREVASGSGKIPTASLPGDFLIPCTVNSWGPSSDGITVHRAEDISLTFKGLQHSLCSKDSLDLSKLLTIRAHIVFTENLDNLNFDFHWASITASNILEYTPMKSVPIIPTALARNLNSPMNIAQVQGTYKCGYLTMDQTRKLLLLLESDPKAYALPLVGVWLSGITHIYSPQVWAFCLRYLFSSSIQERVFSESGSFLVVLYSLTHKEPEFYECIPCSGQTELGFQLLTCAETVHLFKNVEPSDKNPIHFELSTEKQNAETEFFSRICKKLPVRSPPQGSSPSKLSASDHDSGVEDEDLSPRPIPSPHPVSQQVTRIFPSVPELSLVLDGSFIESGELPKTVGISNAESLPSMLHQSIKKKWPLKSTYYLAQCSDDKQNFAANTGYSSLRQLPNHLSQKVPTSKAPRAKQSPLQQQSHCRKVGPQTRKISGSSSSSPSTPCSGPSPDTSVHHPKRLSERLVLNPNGVTQQEESPVRRTSVSSSKQLPSVTQPFLHGSAFSPQNCRRPSELQVPIQVPSCCPASAYNCQFLAPVQCNPINSCQGMGKMSPKQRAEMQPEVAQENQCSAFHQNIICPNICCNTGYTTSSPISLGYHGKIGNCSLDNSLSPGVRLPSSASPCSLQFCAAHSPCVHMPASKTGSDNGMMGLSPDAYRVLTEQDRQLKLLQAQIQRLLKAQAHQACSSEAVTASNALQPEKQVEFVTMETQSSPGLHMRKSVSIAVSTGASLFWNTSSEKQEESIPQGKKEDAEISKEEISISINAAQDASNTSIASSLKVVDMPSFVDSVHLVEEGTHQNTLQNMDVSQALVQNSLLEESISMSLQKEPTEGVSNHMVVISEQNPEPPVSFLPQHPSEDQKLYQDLLGQVNHLLKSSEQDHLPVKAGFVNDGGPRQQSIDAKERDSKSDADVVDKDSVISATLKQLQNLGVAIDSPSEMKKNIHKVENASILACINPEAVIPGLNYMSFANVSMCGLTPNVADLSMEANAIALKYLSENQLSRLSLSHSGQNPPADFSFQDVLHTNMDKSMVGLSLISPNNMSFATKKYMKRYGLIQGNDNSEDEELLVQGSNTGTVKSENTLDKNFTSVLEGDNCWTELSKRTDERLPIHLKGHSRESTNNASPPEFNSPMFRNISNEVFPPRADKSNENSIQILKDLKLKNKLLPGKVEFTEQPGRKDVGDTQVFPGKLHAPALETLNHSDSINSVGTILDVKQLRQLPKLF
ncbi:SCL-interrupting locus protein [Rhea pennata]|uniref:SCL-interrupting locus protein n=1 Tax=Rhea pennata TaxID=8795 RepID=UPI002E26A116